MGGSVNGSILDNAEVTPESEGTIPDLLKDADALEDATEALDRLGSYNNLEDKPQINGVTLSGNKTSGELRVVGMENAEIDNCIENGVLYSTSINDQVAEVLAKNITTDITQYAFCRDGRVMWRTRQAETRGSLPESGAWEEIGGSRSRRASSIKTALLHFSTKMVIRLHHHGRKRYRTKRRYRRSRCRRLFAHCVNYQLGRTDPLVTVTDNNGAHNFYVKDGSSVTNAAVDENGDLIISIQQKPTSSVHPTIHTLEVNAGHVVGAGRCRRLFAHCVNYQLGRTDPCDGH